MTPALWGRMEGGEHHRPHHEKSGQWGEDCGKSEQYAPSYSQPPQQSQQQQPYQAPQGGATPTQEERKKHWYDLDDKRKQELEVYFLSDRVIHALSFFIRSEEASWPVSVPLPLAIMLTRGTARMRRRYICSPLSFHADLTFQSSPEKGSSLVSQQLD